MYHVCDASDNETQFKCPKCDYVHDRRQFMRHHKASSFTQSNIFCDVLTSLMGHLFVDF